MIRAEDMRCGSLMTCVGGPLDGLDLPVFEPDNIEDVYPDIYYESPGFLYQKVKDENGADVCHWYLAWQQADPVRANRWWNFYAYRGVHAEDATLGEIRDTNPVIELTFPDQDP